MEYVDGCRSIATARSAISRSTIGSHCCCRCVLASPTPTSGSSSTATSSPRTSSSRRTGRQSSWTSALPSCSTSADTPPHFRAATPAFSSPEQLQGDVLTTASDVYAIGVLGYVVFTGGWPYPLRSTRRSKRSRRCSPPNRFPPAGSPDFTGARARKLRGDLENILAKAVAKDPNRRYASAQQLADDLESFRRGFPVRARADTVGYRLRRVRRPPSRRLRRRRF